MGRFYLLSNDGPLTIGFGHRIDVPMGHFGLAQVSRVGVTTRKSGRPEGTSAFDLCFIGQGIVFPFPDCIEHAGEGTAFTKRKGMSQAPAKPLTPRDQRFATPLALVPRNVHSLGLTKARAARADVPHPQWLEKAASALSDSSPSRWQTALAERNTWGLMLFGFAGVGVASRRRCKRHAGFVADRLNSTSS
jgi:hypothetical protein